MTHAAPYAVGAFALCGVLSLLLPRTAVFEAAMIGTDEPGTQPVVVNVGADT